MIFSSEPHQSQITVASTAVLRHVKIFGERNANVQLELFSSRSFCSPKGVLLTNTYGMSVNNGSLAFTRISTNS